MRIPTLSSTLLVSLLAVAGPATAEVMDFQVALADRALGSLRFDSGGGSLVVTLNNTPLGVADGRLESTSRAARTDSGALVTQFMAQSDERVVSVLSDGGQILETVVSPTSEMTALSDPAQVPGGVVDPVAALGRLAAANGCPSPLRVYDGRRVVEMATTSESRDADSLRCQLSYRVVAGPGHLSPLGFTSIALTVDYTLGSGQSLQALTAEAGGFAVTVSR